MFSLGCPKIYKHERITICDNGPMGKEIFVASVNEGERIRLTRLMHHLRQVDVASMAKVSITSVTAIEKNRWIPEDHKERILICLGLNNEQPEAANAR